MNSKKYLFALLLTGSLTDRAVWAQTSVTHVRLNTAPAVRKVIVEYELPQVLPGDSIYLELQTASGRIIRPISVNGDVGNGIKPGKNKLIAWDAVRDNIRLDEDVTVLLRVATVVNVVSPTAVRNTPPVVATAPTVLRPTTDRIAEPGIIVSRKSPIPLIGGIATAGLAGYATVLALGINKNVDDYNSKPFADNLTEGNRFQSIKANIDKDKSTFTIVAGAALVVGIATGIYYFVNQRKAGRKENVVQKPARTSLLLQSGQFSGLVQSPGSPGISLGLSRTF